MKTKGLIVILAVLAIFLVAIGFRADSGNLLRLTDGKKMSLKQALPDLAGARAVFIGELHNRKSHHAAQLEVIRALKEAGVPVAVGLEMFQKKSQQQLNKWVEGGMSESEFRPLYYRNWNLDWSLYADIFRYARKQRIPMIALNVRPEIVKQVAREGFGSLTPGQKAQLPPVTCVVDKDYKEFIRRALGAHGHGGMEFTNFCEAQLLWDSAMAVHLLDHLKDHPGCTMVVIAGRGHAWKQGIPRQVKMRSDLPVRVILPQVAGRNEADSLTPKDADYLWLNE